MGDKVHWRRGLNRRCSVRIFGAGINIALQSAVAATAFAVDNRDCGQAIEQMNAIKHMQCMEVWGGNRPIDSGVIMPGVDAWVYSQPCENQDAGGDVHYVSTCCGGVVVRM